MKRLIWMYVLGLVFAFAWVASPVADGASSDEGEVLVLDTASYWRCHVTLRPVVYGTVEAAKPEPEAARQPHSPLPPSDWAQPDFDDQGWWRDPGPFFAGSRKNARRYGMGGPEALALVALRGKFRVSDPDKVKGLRLSTVFRGGMVVYLNGREVARSYLRSGERNFETLADDYPPKAYTKSNGRPLGAWRDNLDFKDLAELRIRRLTDLALPIGLLREGTNVLALELHRTALPPDWLKLGSRRPSWCTVGLVDVKLRSLSNSGIVTNVSRPTGLQVWNANPLQGVYKEDYGDPNEKVHPIRLVTTVNGVASGQVVVSSDQPIPGLSGRMTPLQAVVGRGIIPLEAIQVRYARAYGNERGKSRFDILEEVPAAELPPESAVGDAKGIPGAVQPIWVTVKVPADASTDDYTGTLTIEVKGHWSIEFPVQLRVCPWKLPHPRDFNTHIDMAQSPESVALRYDVPFWSDEHCELMEKSFQLLSQVGNKTVYVPLICKTHFGNAESMVRWIRQPDGSFQLDFSIVERYLDVALKYLKPTVVCLYVWDFYLGTPNPKSGSLTAQGPMGALVSVLDPATGKVEEREGPRYTDAGAKAFWQPVADGVRQALESRGLGGVMMLGISGDPKPLKEVVQLWKELLPGVPWVNQGHADTKKIWGVPVGYAATVYHAVMAPDPDQGHSYGWKRQRLVVDFPRIWPAYPYAPPRFHGLGRSRMRPELNIQGNQRGVGRLGGDFFRVLPNQRGEKFGYLFNRYRESDWHNRTLTNSLTYLAPGPKGALATVRFEMMREGLQECEARIFIEKALLDEALSAKLGEELAQRCQAILDERTRYNLWAPDDPHYRMHSNLRGGGVGWHWYAGSGWQQRSAKLYNAAAEVAAALGRQSP